MANTHPDLLTVGLAQIAPVWLHRIKTTEKIVEYIRLAGKKECDLVCFGEALLPGYPFWIELTDGAKFNSDQQKKWHAHYVDQAVNIQRGDLLSIQEACKQADCAAVIGCIELGSERGAHSIYASAVYIDKKGSIQSVHRKLMPTYEERLSWAPGDGHGLRVHDLGKFKVGALNCWENWMPLVRSTLYGLGEDLHIAIWPGGEHNTHDITRFIAKESRSYVVSVSGLLRLNDIQEHVPNFELIQEKADQIRANGASCVASPDGEWLLQPVLDKEDLFVVEINHSKVREERQNFDPSGHYSRPDVTQLHVNRKRQSTIYLEE